MSSPTPTGVPAATASSSTCAAISWAKAPTSRASVAERLGGRLRRIAMRSSSPAFDDQLVHRKLAGHLFGEADEREAIAVADAEHFVEARRLVGVARPAAVPQL